MLALFNMLVSSCQGPCKTAMDEDSFSIQARTSLNEQCAIPEQALTGFGSGQLSSDEKVLAKRPDTCVQAVIPSQTVHENEYPLPSVSLSLTHGGEVTFVQDKKRITGQRVVIGMRDCRWFVDEVKILLNY